MIAEIAFPIPLHRTFYYRLPPELETRCVPGRRVLAPFGFRQAAGVIVKLHNDAEADLSGFKELKSVIKPLDEGPVFKDDIVELAFWMRGRWNAPLGLSLEAFFGGRLSDPGISEAQKDDAERAPDAPAAAVLPPLSGFAAEALARIGKAVGGGSPSAFLLETPPDLERGKLFAALCARALASGGQALLMVPDLNDMGPFAEAVRNTLGESGLSLWHSRLTPKQRKEAWTGALTGRSRIVIGTRSAAFLPFKGLALAIMDSEQEHIYKQEEAEPHFHARDLLLKRSRAHGACLTLASPCPSVEAYGRALAGEFELVAPQAPPKGSGGVLVYDMNNYSGLIAEPLAEKIKLTIESGRKVLLLTGRKGYTGLIFCVKCGWTRRCARCRVPMSVIKDGAEAKEMFLCRRCGRKDPYSEVCPRCSGTVFRRSGLGTQKAEEAVNKLFPGARTARFDGDVVRKSAKNARETLEGFFKGGTEILVGTRIAARDRGLETLGLAAVLDADSEISSSDFRASEKAFQLFYEAYHSLKAPGAELAVQTREPGHYVLSLLKEMDYRKFLDSELSARKDFFYPPFSFLAKVSFSSFDLKALEAFSEVFLKTLDFSGESGGEESSSEVLGPVGAADPKKRKFFSQYYLIKAADEKALSLCLEKLRALKAPKNVKMTVSADPHG